MRSQFLFSTSYFQNNLQTLFEINHAVPPCAVLMSFFLKETDWTKLEEKVTSLPASTREQSSLYDGFGFQVQVLQ